MGTFKKGRKGGESNYRVGSHHTVCFDSPEETPCKKRLSFVFKAVTFAERDFHVKLCIAVRGPALPRDSSNAERRG